MDRDSLLRKCLRWLRVILQLIFTPLLLAWATLAIYFSNLPAPWLRLAAAALFALGTIAAFALLPNRRRTARFFYLAFAVVLVWWLLIPPSNDRDWLPEYAVLPHAVIAGNLAHVHDIRDFHYITEDEYEVRYYDKTYDLDELTSVDFALSYWDGNTDIAHFMLSFGFRDEDYLAVSVETRREKGEAWNTIGGFFKQYELIFILGDERDLFRLRTHIRGEDLYVYPSVLKPEEGRAIFLSILERVNRLHDEPQWYNTITHNCMTSLLPHVRDYRRSKGFDIRFILNGLSDRMAYENGSIPNDLPFEELRRKHHVNQYVEGDPIDYSRSIRPYLHMRD